MSFIAAVGLLVVAISFALPGLGLFDSRTGEAAELVLILCLVLAVVLLVRALRLFAGRPYGSDEYSPFALRLFALYFAIKPILILVYRLDLEARDAWLHLVMVFLYPLAAVATWRFAREKQARATP